MTMFLKVMHGTVDEFMAEVGEPQASYDLYADVVSCHFRRYDRPEQSTSDSPVVWGEAHIWVREPIKTAEVPGHCEVEKFVQLTGDAFLMNEQGRTISKFVQPRRRPICEFTTADTMPNNSTTLNRQNGPIAPGQTDNSDQAFTARLLRDLPYWSAIRIRKACAIAGEKGILAILDSARIAVDA